MKIKRKPSNFKKGKIPLTGKYSDANILLICKKCKMKYWYYGEAKPEPRMKCVKCNKEK